MSGRPRKSTGAAYAADISRHGSAVYDGRVLLGTMFDDGCVVVAETADGHDLGSFTSRSAAHQAIIEAAKSR